MSNVFLLFSIVYKVYQFFVRILFILTHCCVLRQESRDSDGFFGSFPDPECSDFRCRGQFELLGLIELVHFLGGQPCFCNGGGGFGEAIVQVFVVTDANGISDFIPIVICI